MSLRTLSAGAAYPMPKQTKHKYRLDKAIYEQASVVWQLANIEEAKRTPQESADLETALSMLAMLTDRPRHGG